MEGIRIVNYISGHLDLTPSEFEIHYRPAIDQALARGEAFVVGDARGTDAMAQRYLLGKTTAVVVYHMFTNPRNNAGFAVVGGFENDETRDTRMTADSHQDIAWVRPGREKSGTQKNLDRRHQNRELAPQKSEAEPDAARASVNVAPPIANLLVLRSPDIHRTAGFYRALGLLLTLERHGSGPEHYASNVNGFVFEIYPLGEDRTPTTEVRVGFRVDSVDQVVPLVQAAGAEVVSGPHDSPWGRRAVVRDLDGHTVELVTPP